MNTENPKNTPEKEHCGSVPIYRHQAFSGALTGTAS